MAGEEVAAGAAVAGIGVFVLFFIILWATMMIAAVLLIIFWIFMIVDVAKRDFKQPNDKTVWILVVVLAGWIGATIYYFVIKKPDKH